MESAMPVQKPFSVERMLISRKLRKLTKMVKPLMRLLSRRSRTNAITPSTCNFDIEEAQNKLNEAEPFDVEFRFHEDENAINEAIENRLRETVSSLTAPAGIRVISNGVPAVQPIMPGTYFAVPVHFIEAPAGGFSWVPVADADFAPNSAVTELQQAAQQVPCVV